MQYLMKSGGLYGPEDRCLCRLQGVLFSQGKTICSSDGTPVLQLRVRELDPRPERQGDVRSRAYILEDLRGGEVASARPGYAPEEDPLVAGWPVCRAPRVDHADVMLGRESYVLEMRSSRHYAMMDARGAAAVQVVHRGMMGGWTLETEQAFSPEVLCAVFAFCRYLEKENEFMVV